MVDLRSLAVTEKRGKLAAWSVGLGTDPKSGLPVPISHFDPVMVFLDPVNMYISPMDVNQVSYQNICS